MFAPIPDIPPLMADPALQKPAAENKPQDGLFASVFKGAVDNVKQTQMEVERTEYLLATGQLDNPAALSIAETKSAIAVDLLVQMRNKAVEAYSELSRISL